jgi:hypothetical protein
MAGTPSSPPGENLRERKRATLAEILVPMSDPVQQTELERYRVKYEAVHGPTDLTRRYTSTWPLNDQAWLVAHEPKRWFEGLPPFGRAYFLGKIQAAAKEGNLDAIPDEFISLFIKGELRLDSGHRSK